MKKRIALILGILCLLLFISPLFFNFSDPLALSSEEIAELRKEYPEQNSVKQTVTFDPPSLAEAAEEYGLFHVEIISFHHLGTYKARVISDSKNRVAPGTEIQLKLKQIGFLAVFDVGTEILVPAAENKYGVFEAFTFLSYYVTESDHILSVRTDLFSDPTYNGHTLPNTWKELTQ